MIIKLTVNGVASELAGIRGSEDLLEILRDCYGLTGAKYACGEGQCGACTVYLDGAPVCSCLVPVGQAEGCEIRTIEGLVDNGRLTSIQRAFVERGAVQCGFCTPGMIIKADYLLGETDEPTDEQIREALIGNLCRCTGYEKIVEAVRYACMTKGVE